MGYAGDSQIYSTNPVKVALINNLRRFIEPFKADKADQIKANVLNLLRSFETAEKILPGFTWEFLRGFMEKLELKDAVNIEDMSLRLAGMDNDVPTYTSLVPRSYDLEKYASELKLVLSRIPSEISVRQDFIELIRQIATAIKGLLECVNSILNTLSHGIVKQDLDRLMLRFVDYSKRFSSALKGYFHGQKAQDLYASANLLVQQTNQILLFIRNTH